MEADRKRKRPAEDWEDKRRTRTGGEIGKPCAGAEEAAVAGHPATADNVESEVEEFFAIVRRMHAATRQYSADGRATAASGRYEEGKGHYRWRPSFMWEDFDEGGRRRVPDAGDGGGGGRSGEVASATSAPTVAVGRGGRREERSAENGIAVFLDLNAEPEPEPEPQLVSG